LDAQNNFYGFSNLQGFAKTLKGVTEKKGVRAEAADLNQAGPNPAACLGLAGQIGTPPSDIDRTVQRRHLRGITCARGRVPAG
jgi:hypothetical protein